MSYSPKVENVFEQDERHLSVIIVVFCYKLKILSWNFFNFVKIISKTLILEVLLRITYSTL